jgi:hypothetical protein
MLILVSRSCARIAAVFVAVGGVLMGFQIVLIAVAASLTTSNSFEQLGRITLPRFILHSWGLGQLTFAGATTFGYYDPLVIMLLVQFAVYVGSEPAGDVETSLVDLVLARPIPRERLVTRSIVVVTGVTLALTFVMAVGTGAGLLWLAPPNAAWPEPRTVGILMAHLMTLAWAFGCVTVAVAAWARRRGAAQAAVAVAAIALYFIDMVGESWERAAPMARLFPFHYYHGAALLNGRSNVGLDLSVFMAIGAAAIAVAYWQFGRRDL